MRFGVKVSGLGRIRRGLLRMPAAAREEVRAESPLQAERIIQVADPFVPFEEGDLRRSARVVPPTGEKRILTGISYGGKDVPYAKIQHENEKFEHDPPQKAHWLSDTVKAEQSTTNRNLIRAVLRGLKKAFS